jgi:LysR family transcriptional regulator, glycine cleavage system transcriptional activator
MGNTVQKHRVPLLNSLPSFEAAARHQSIKRACDELYLQHSSVSRHILNLERNLGRPLVRRTRGRIALTEDGEILFRAAGAALSHIKKAFAQLRDQHDPERLVISVDPDFAGLWLVPRLADFYAIVPDTLVEILVQRGEPLSHDPRINCAIHYVEAGTNGGNGEMLFRSRLFPVCTKRLMERVPLKSPDDLRYHVLVHDRSHAEWEEFLAGCRLKHKIHLGLGPILSETALCLDAALRGQGVAMGDDCLASLFLAEGRLVRPFRSSVLSKNSYYFVVPQGAPQHPAVNKFRAWLMRNIERHRKALRNIKR